MISELPKIISDDEFAALVEERQRQPRAEHDRWDNAGLRPSHELSDGLPESSIEQQFPRIAEKLVLAWPSEACAMYITSLLVNKRETRQGFPKAVVEDLLMLHAINEMLVRGGSRPLRPAAKSASHSGSALRRRR